ncbi:MAG: DUF1800 domain-containing protein [Ferruginibacter sp.]
MKRLLSTSSKFILFFIGCFFLYSFLQEPGKQNQATNFRFPYKEAGLTERQAAAHMLSRFSFGATPGQVDEVVQMGLEKWFTQQLNGGIPDDSLQARLVDYDAINLTNTEINKIFPRPIQVLRMARDEGFLPKKDSFTDDERKAYKKQLADFVKDKKFRRQGVFVHQFINYKILRAAYSNNQLQEVLTDFWFNHFNVSFTKKDCIAFMPAYERDIIRPNVTGNFEDMLLATAKSPAMLLYLDNFNSSGSNDNGDDDERMLRRLQRMNASLDDSASKEMVQKLQKRKKNQGLNENYAREVMELHTMGVDGGYTQSDVTQAARILTGWTLYPVENSYGSGMKKILDKIGEDKLTEQGFVHDGDFLFAMNKHDKKEKIVLGKKFPERGGYQEGVDLLKMLAHHPSTASFICKKLAVHFVSDNPAKSLVDKMTKTFLEKDGNIKEVLITMACAPEFWNKSVIRDKTKSPFEFAISAIRALHTDIKQPYQVFTWLDKMGQKIYYYQAPTGFPDKAQYWINTGALLNRMNFGLSIASKQMRGVNTDLLSVNNNHEPESPSAALVTYGKLLMPERDLTETIKRLTPLLTQPALEKKLDDIAGKPSLKSEATTKGDEDMVEDAMKENEKPMNGNKKMDSDTDTMLAQVVGIIIGSPEFQRK